MIRTKKDIGNNDELVQVLLQGTKKIKMSLETPPLVSKFLDIQKLSVTEKKTVRVLPALIAQVLRYIQMGEVQRAAKYYVMLKKLYVQVSK